MSKQFYLPMRDANDPHKVTLIPVSEEVYTNITPETNRIRSRRQYHGQCCCPKQYLWKCDGDCDVCEYRAAGDNLSLDYETEMHGDTFADTSDTEEIVTDQILMRSPYSGDTERNVENAKKYSRFAVDRHYLPITPHIYFTQFMDDNIPAERDTAIFMNWVLMSKCVELWVFGDTVSSGMKAEIERAKRKHMKIRYFSEELEETT